MGKIRKRVLNLILSIFWAIVYFAYLLIFILVVFANFGYNDATIAIFSIMSTIIFVFVVLLFITTITSYQKEKEHLNFNEEIFGERLYFYNLLDFVKDIYEHKHKNKEAYVIAYSPIKSSTSNEVYQSKELKQFYNYLAKYFIEEFTNKKNKKVKYCFDSNMFLIYCQGSKDDVMDIVTKLQNISYSLIKKYDLRLFIQNFFGFCPVSSNNDLYEAIARAKITRRIAEYNFEPVLEFDEKYVLDEKENSVAEALANGLKNNEFLVYYQPKFGLTTKTFVGCEALVRWNSKELGFVSPLGFINYAENKGLIHEIDLFVFEQVCIDLADLKKRGKRLLPVSINFSLYEFYCPTFLDDIKSILTKYDINPMLIEIEITEETQHANSFLVISLLKKLRELGMRVLLDDFGLGFSNFGSMKILPIDTIKIDKSFIDEIAYDYKARQIVKTIIEFGRIMGIQTVAEGVEDAKQVETLKKLKCDIIQGFYFSKPMPKADYDKFLSSNPFEKKEANQ